MIEFILDVLRLFDRHDIESMLAWRTDEGYEPVMFWVNTSDLLAWGCSDGETITPETLPMLKKAIEDCLAVDPILGAMAGCELFACRVNKSRPQGASYPENRNLWKLFDECGPEREVGLGNPYRPGEYLPHAKREPQ